MLPGGRPIIDLDIRIICRRFSVVLLQKIQGALRQVLTIYLINVTSFIMFTFAVLLAHLSCISSLGILMSLTTTTNQGSLI